MLVILKTVKRVILKTAMPLLFDEATTGRKRLDLGQVQQEVDYMVDEILHVV
jgi:hypothetical protein